MGFVVKKKRLNQFRAVSIPSNKDLFMRVGRRQLPPSPDGQVANFTGDTMSQISYLESELLKPNQMPSDTV